MSDFISTKLRKIKLSENEWVKIPEKISFEIAANIGQCKNESEMLKLAMTSLIKEWNLKSEEGEDIPLTNENILVSY